jgi:hypothetical protein
MQTITANMAVPEGSHCERKWHSLLTQKAIVSYNVHPLTDHMTEQLIVSLKRSCLCTTQPGLLNLVHLFEPLSTPQKKNFDTNYWMQTMSLIYSLQETNRRCITEQIFQLLCNLC